MMKREKHSLGKGDQSFCGQWTVDKFQTNVSLFLFSLYDQYKTR